MDRYIDAPKAWLNDRQKLVFDTPESDDIMMFWRRHESWMPRLNWKKYTCILHRDIAPSLVIRWPDDDLLFLHVSTYVRCRAKPDHSAALPFLQCLMLMAEQWWTASVNNISTATSRMPAVWQLIIHIMLTASFLGFLP